MVQLIGICILLALVVLAFKSLKHPGIALGLIWCMYGIEQVVMQGNSFLIRNSYFINVLLTLIAVVAVARNFSRKRFRKLRIPAALTIATMLYGYCAITLSWAPDFSESQRWYVQMLPYFVAFAMIAPFCFSNPEQLNKAVQVLLYFGGFILIGLAFSEIDNRRIVIAETSTGKLGANPLAIASFGAYVTLAAITTIYRLKRKKGFYFLLHLAITALAFYVMAASGSRGAFVAVVLAMAIWLPMTAKLSGTGKKRSSWSSFALGGIVLLGIVYFASNNEQSWRWGQAAVEKATDGRFQMASDLLDVYAKNGPAIWIMGLGSSAAFHYIGFYPHIVIAEVLAEEGIIGLILFVVFCFLVFKNAYKTLQSRKFEREDRILLGLMISLFTVEFALSFKQGSLLGQSAMFGVGVTACWYSSILRRKYLQSQTI